MSQYSIFHTSHCGSTLLASLLSKSIPTLTEPSWSHRIHKYPGKTNTFNFIQSNIVESTLVKFSSAYCYAAPLVHGKKVFLYRSLASHLKKMISNSSYLIHDKEFQLNVLKGNLNKQLGYNIDQLRDMNPLFTHALIWVDRILHINESNDIIFIDADTFLSNRDIVSSKVCDFFDIKYIPMENDFDAKRSGLNHNSQPIDISSVELVKFDTRKNNSPNPLHIFSVVRAIESKYSSINKDTLYGVINNKDQH